MPRLLSALCFLGRPKFCFAACTILFCNVIRLAWPLLRPFSSLDARIAAAPQSNSAMSIIPYVGLKYRSGVLSFLLSTRYECVVCCERGRLCRFPASSSPADGGERGGMGRPPTVQLRPAALRERVLGLCASVDREPKAAGSAMICEALAAVKAALTGVPDVSLVEPQCALVKMLLHGMPTRLSREAVHSLVDLAEAGYAPPLLSSLSTLDLFSELLDHANRDVRSSGLQLLSTLAPSAATLDDDAIGALARRPLLQRLCATIGDKAPSEKAAEMAIQAAVALRGLCRSARGVSLCPSAGLLALLQALPPRSRQGALGVAIGELQLRLGRRVGLPSRVGSALGAALCAATVGGFAVAQDKVTEAVAVEEEGATAASLDEFTDALMEFDGGGQLRLHRIVLAVRAPLWAVLLDSHSGAADAHIAPTADGGGKGAASRLEARRVWRVGGKGGADSLLTLEGCACLWRFAVSGTARLPSNLSPKALLAMADALGMSALLFAPPTDASGVPWLQRHLACAVGLPEGADINFVLNDGTLPAHRALLAARSEYFRRMFSWGGGDDRRVVVADASCASFIVLLRHVYTGATTSAFSPPRIAAHTTTAAAPAPAPLEAKGEARTDGRTEGSTGASREDGVTAEVAAWRRLALQAAEANATLASGEQVRGVKTDSMEEAAAPLAAAIILEVLLLARRYLLTSLADEASTRLEGVLRATDVVPLLLQAQMECEEDAVQQIADWAVSHFEDVSGQIDSWLGTNLITAPLAVRRLGEEGVADLREQLRVAMLRERYGL